MKKTIFVALLVLLILDSCFNSTSSLYNNDYYAPEGICLNIEALDSCLYYYYKGEKIPISQVNTSSSVSLRASLYGLANHSSTYEANGLQFSVTNNVHVSLKTDTYKQAFLDLIDSYNCTASKRGWCTELEYIITLPDDSTINTISFANALYETGLFEFASPDFVTYNPLYSADTYYSNQWYLKNTGQYGSLLKDINVESAWSISEGSGVCVAVIDDGVDPSHPDYAANLVVGYNPLPSYVTVYGTGNHGTVCAGIIGAIKDNNIGIAGVAPECSIMPVNMMEFNSASSLSIADCMYWCVNNGADVINCSWGTAQSETITNAIYYATTNGRGGKGCVVIVAAGNDLETNNGPVSYPAILADVMAVGAVDYNFQRKTFKSYDSKPWSSRYGPALDVCAPGVYISSTDMVIGGYSPVTDGEIVPGEYSDPKYIKLFYGTSAAAPLVSGIAALVISKYPDLTQQQVRRAIELSCYKPSGYTYTQDSYYPSSIRNNEVGYGVVDAAAALYKASEFHQQNLIATMPGIDFIIDNKSSYFLNNTYIELTGKVNGQTFTFISSDPGGVYPGKYIGYPVILGETPNIPAGASISNLSLSFYAESPDYSGLARIGAKLDADPLSYSNVKFDMGYTYTTSLPNTTLASGKRSVLKVSILNI